MTAEGGYLAAARSSSCNFFRARPSSIGIGRFVEKVTGTVGEGFGAIGQAGRIGQNGDFQMREVVGLDPFQHFEAVLAGHPQIQEEEVGKGMFIAVRVFALAGDR